jgi:carbamoyl-phosphate synthase large subunit
MRCCRLWGGQTALNLTKALHDQGTLQKHGVELIGAVMESIELAEDRQLFQGRDGGSRAALSQLAKS